MLLVASHILLVLGVLQLALLILQLGPRRGLLGVRGVVRRLGFLLGRPGVLRIRIVYLFRMGGSLLGLVVGLEGMWYR